MRTIVLIIFLLSLQVASAQHTYPEVDSISYDLYQEKSWKKLLKFAKVAEKDSIGFFYLDLRKAIACYELGKWEKAKILFNAALEKNPGSEIAMDYLFTIYHFTGYKKEADRMFQLLSAELKPTKDYKSVNLLSGIYMEAGLKVSSEDSIAGNTNYYYGSLYHQFSPSVQLMQAVGYFEQSLSWSNFKQVQYSITPTFYMGKGWEMSLATNLIYFMRDLNVISETSTLILNEQIQIPGGILIKDSTYYTLNQRLGTETVYTSDFHYTISKRIKEFSFNLQGSAYFEEVRPEYDTLAFSSYRSILTFPNGIINTIDQGEQTIGKIEKKSRFQQFQAGGGIDYTFRFNKSQSLRAGVEGQYLQLENSEEIVWIPYVEFVYLNKFNLFGYYFQKGFYPVSIFAGSHLYNNYDRIGSRISLTGGVKLNKNSSLVITLQQDNITDAFSSDEYKFNSGYVGIYIKL